MKKFTLAVTALLLSLTTLFAQTPNGFKYQAVLHDSEGKLMTSQDLTVRITILEGSSTGTPVYQEKHQVQTNESGLISLNIGTGIVLVGTMSEVAWSSNSHFLSTGIDLDNTGTFKQIGVSQILAVPYALHAKTAEEIDDADADPSNELIETFEFVGNQLTITEAGVARSVTLEVDEITDPLNLVLGMGNSAGDKQIKDLAAPTDAGDAVNKAVTDAMVAKAKADSLYFQAKDNEIINTQEAIQEDIDVLYMYTTRDSIDIDVLFAKLGTPGKAEANKILVVDDNKNIAELGNVGAEGNLTVDGNGTFNSNLTVAQDAQVGNDLRVTNRSYLSNGVEIEGTNLISQTTFTDETESTTPADGSIVVNGGAGVQKSLNVGGELNVAGASTLQGDVVANKNVTVDKNLAVKKDLDVDGLTTLDETNINTNDGEFNIEGTNGMGVDVDGEVMVHSTKDIRLENDSTFILLDEVERRIYMEALSNDIHLDAGHDIALTADGQVHLFGKEGVQIGDINDPVTINGPTVVDDTLVVNGNLKVLGKFSIPGTLQVGNLICDTLGQFNDSIYVDKNALIHGDLQVDGTLKLDSLDIDGLTQLDETRIVTNDGALSVTGANEVIIDVNDSVIIHGEEHGELVINNGDLRIGGTAGTWISSNATTKIDGSDSVQIMATVVDIDGTRVEVDAADILLTATDTLKAEGLNVDLIANENAKIIAGDSLIADADDVEINSTHDVDINADDEVLVSAISKIELLSVSDSIVALANEAVVLDAGTDVDVNAGANVLVDAGNNVDIDATADVTVDAVAVRVNASDSVDVLAANNVNLASTAADININAANDVDVDATNILLTANTDIEAAAVAVRVNASDSIDAMAANNVNIASTAADINVNAANDVDVDATNILLTANTDIEAAAVAVRVNASDSIDAMAANNVNIASTAADVNVDASAGISLDAGAASNFNTQTGNLSLDAEAGTVVIDGATGVDVTASEANSDVDITADRDVNINAANDNVNIGSAAASQFITNDGDLTLTAGNSGELLATGAAGVDVTSTAGTVDVSATTGISATTAAGNVAIEASAGNVSANAVGATSDLDLDAGQDVDVDAARDVLVDAEDDVIITTQNNGADLRGNIELHAGDSIIMDGPTRFTSTVDIDTDLNVDNDLFVSGTSTLADDVHITSTSSTGTYTAGALVIDGGVGIAENLHVQDNIQVGLSSANTSVMTIYGPNSTGYANGGLVLAGSTGLGVAGNIFSNGRIVTGDGTSSTSTVTGTIVAAGGVGIGENLNVSGEINANGQVSFTANIASTNQNNGTLVVDGGMGVDGTLNVQTLNAVNTNFSNITVTGNSAIGNDATDQTTITGNLTVVGTAVDIDGANSVTIDAGGANNVNIEGSLFNNNNASIPGTLGVGGVTSLTANVASTLTTNGTLVVTGGVGISGDVNIGGTLDAGTLTVTDLDIDGTTDLDQVDIVTDDGQFNVTGGSGVQIDVAAASRFVTSLGTILVDAENDALTLSGGSGATLSAFTSGNVTVVSNAGAVDIDGSLTGTMNDVTIEGTSFEGNDVTLAAAGQLTVDAIASTGADMSISSSSASTTAIGINASAGRVNITGADAGGANVVIENTEFDPNSLQTFGNFTVVTTGANAISLNANAASNFTTTGGNLTLTASAGQVDIQGGFAGAGNDVKIENILIEGDHIHLPNVLPTESGRLYFGTVGSYIYADATTGSVYVVTPSNPAPGLLLVP